jgi:hypothetical protein
VFTLGGSENAIGQKLDAHPEKEAGREPPQFIMVKLDLS